MQDRPLAGNELGADVLLEIIRTQTEIVKMGVDLGGVMSFVAERAQLLTDASAAVVELAEGDEMVYRAASGFAAAHLGLRLDRQGSLSGLCVAQRKIMHCTDAETDERVARMACRKVGIRSMVALPLNHLDTTVGVLKVMAKEPGRFDAADIRVLELMSELIAAAMFQATKFEADALYHQATHDALTGLANRALFFDRLRQCITLSQRHRHQFGIINVDMDGLKSINDQYGHRAGDAAIREVARRIHGGSRQSDTVARLGGDEFSVLLTRVDSGTGAHAQCRRLADRIDQPMQFEHHWLPLRASIGLAVFPDDGEQIDMLVDKADQAMYDAKRLRKDRQPA
jgi:diguanylate cyclase (GGDEF)-like protein